MGRDCASERGQRLEHGRLRDAPGRSWGQLEERALPSLRRVRGEAWCAGRDAKAWTRWGKAGA